MNITSIYIYIYIYITVMTHPCPVRLHRQRSLRSNLPFVNVATWRKTWALNPAQISYKYSVSPSNHIDQLLSRTSWQGPSTLFTTCGPVGCGWLRITIFLLWYYYFFGHDNLLQRMCYINIQVGFDFEQVMCFIL